MSVYVSSSPVFDYMDKNYEVVHLHQLCQIDAEQYVYNIESVSCLFNFFGSFGRSELILRNYSKACVLSGMKCVAETGVNGNIVCNTICRHNIEYTCMVHHSYQLYWPYRKSIWEKNPGIIFGLLTVFVWTWWKFLRWAMFWHLSGKLEMGLEFSRALS